MEYRRGIWKRIRGRGVQSVVADLLDLLPLLVGYDPESP